MLNLCTWYIIVDVFAGMFEQRNGMSLLSGSGSPRTGFCNINTLKYVPGYTGTI